MSYKTIPGRCNDNKRVRWTVNASVELAERFQAHLVGPSISPPALVVATGTPGTPDSTTIDERCYGYLAVGCIGRLQQLSGLAISWVWTPPEA
jgi:hypothetical protein